MGYVCGFGIPSSAASPDLAYDYINAATSLEAMTFLVNEYGYGAANQEAVAAADQEIVELLQVGDLDMLDQTVFYESLTPEQREAFVSNWDRVKAAP